MKVGLCSLGCMTVGHAVIITKTDIDAIVGFSLYSGIQKVRTELTVLTSSNMLWLTTVEQVITAIKQDFASI